MDSGLTLIVESRTWGKRVKIFVQELIVAGTSVDELRDRLKYLTRRVPCLSARFAGKRRRNGTCDCVSRRKIKSVSFNWFRCFV